LTLLSRTCEYSIQAVLYIAAHSDQETGNKIGIRTIAGALDAPVHYLGKILQTLTRHQLLSSIKGPNGGFYLDKKQRSQTPLAIVNTIDGGHVFNQCALGFRECSDSHPCPIHFAYVQYREGLRTHLAEHTIQDLAANPEGYKKFS